jgi:oligopeptide transport system substrate-binding protein
MQLTGERRTAILSLCSCLLLLMLAACGSNGAAPGSTASQAAKAPSSKQIFVWPFPVQDLPTFDAALSTDANSNTAISMVFTGLVEFNDKLGIIDQLAQSHNVSPDGLTWTFHLRPNLKFSDGTPLTSADVAYSIDRALDPAVKSPVAPGYLNLIKDSAKRNKGQIKTLIGDSLLTPDPNTIEIIINKPAAYFLDALAYPDSYVVEKKLIDQYGNTNWTDHLNQGGGDGPWMVSQWIHNKEIVLVPNPYYYGPHPQLSKIVLPFYKETDTIYRAYQVGQVSIAQVPTANLDQARHLPQEQLHPIPELWISFYNMNYLMKPFDNIKIRQAFSLAINRELLAQNIWHGSVIPSTHIIPQGMPGYNPNLTLPGGVKNLAGDPTMARQLFDQGLQEEGMTRATMPQIVLTAAPQGVASQEQEYTAVQQMWQNTLGIQVKLNFEDYNKFLADTDNNNNNAHGLMLWAFGWVADYPDPQDWTSLQFGKGAAYNQTNFGQNDSSTAAQQQTIQQQLAQADVMQDQAQRIATYQRLEQQLVNLVAWSPVYQVVYQIVLKPCVQGMVFNDQFVIPPDDWHGIYISTNPTCINTSTYQ